MGISGSGAMGGMGGMGGGEQWFNVGGGGDREFGGGATGGFLDSGGKGSAEKKVSSFACLNIRIKR